jgi:hypothetical protein
MNRRSEAKSWAAVFAFAMAMAWVEAAAVFYLRTLVGRIDPHQPSPLPVQGQLGEVELVREAATLIMLAGAGWLAGTNWRARLGYGIMAFGVWDIWYYIFLRQITGWPSSLLDWDVLFLIPLPWWGPVIAPVSISLLLILSGTIVSQFGGSESNLARGLATLNLVGVILSLLFYGRRYRRREQGPRSRSHTVLPTQFNWPLFILALLLMSAPVLDMVRLFCRQASNG